MDYKTLKDDELLALLKQTSFLARTLYKQKKMLKEEHRQRFTPLSAKISPIYDQAPGGLTIKQISEIRKWAKKPHSTDALIAFISELMQKEVSND